MKMVTSNDVEGRIIAVSLIDSDGKAVLRADWEMEVIHFNGADFPVSLFRRFVRTINSMISDHHVPPATEPDGRR